MSRYCSECGKARKACICDAIVPLCSEVELIILQHPTEQHRPMGTARILSLSLANCRILVGEDFRQHEELNHLLAQADVQHFVLYPSEHSQPSTGLIREPGKRLRVILLDGTWKKAYRMWQVNTHLHQLPAVHLPTDLRGHYRIRKAPSDNALSTVEAGYYLLQSLHTKQDFTPLIAAFNAMIDYQIQQMPPGVFERNYLHRCDD